MNPHQERLFREAKAELAAAIQDAVAENPDVGEDDIAHDIAVSLAYGIPDRRVREEFCRTEGIPNPDPRTPQQRVWEERRRPMNNQSLEHATRHGQPWLNYEDALVLEWDRHEDSLPELAELLGRTTEAVRQRHTALRREPRDRVRATPAHPRRVRAAGGRTARPETIPPPCPVCGLVHPGEC